MTDDKGRLTGNVSVRDLRLVLKDKIDLQLEKPISAFLEEVRAGQAFSLTSPRGGSRDVPPIQAVTVLAGDSVRSAITRMVSSRIHRVYVVDPQSATQGVISITDVFAYLHKAGFKAEVVKAPHTKDVAPTPRLTAEDLEKQNKERKDAFDKKEKLPEIVEEKAEESSSGASVPHGLKVPLSLPLPTFSLPHLAIGPPLPRWH